MCMGFEYRIQGDSMIKDSDDPTKVKWQLFTDEEDAEFKICIYDD